MKREVISSHIHDFAQLKIPLESILSATSNFDDKHVFGRGGYFKNYKGQLSWSDELISIDAKRFHQDGDEMFWTEVSMLSSLNHLNLVSLLGFCYENGEKIIITRREIQGSLSNHLSDATLLTWVQRLKISVGLAHALSYIHYDEPRDFCVLHRNISSFTVLLTDNFEPKLSFFETSMKIEASQRHHSFHTSQVWSTKGCIDPTYEKTNSVNHKTDMYSFGIVLFELLCGRTSIIANDTNKYLVPAAILNYNEKKLDEIIDWDLWKQMDPQSFDMFAETAYECLNEEESQRPSMDEIVTRLERVLELQLEHQNKIHSSPNHLAHLRIPLEDIESATNHFDILNVTWTSGYYKIYMGELCWSSELINITAWRLIHKEWDDEIEQQFWTEISMLSSLKHKNVVSILGFCNEVGAETIIYKHGSTWRLDKYLSDATMLTWVKRLKISVGIAHALRYIHYDEPRDFSVIHRNIRSYTILSDVDGEPKLSGFEHSVKIKASERHHSCHTDSVWSMKGYRDPTYVETSSVNHTSDIYSFGIVLFELLCSRNSVIDDEDNKYLAPMAIFHYREKIPDGIIDPDLWKQMDPQSFNVFAEIAYGCLNEERCQRPKIDDIVTRLEKALELQLACKNTENFLVAAEVEGTSTNHDKGSVTFVATGVKSHLSKKPVSSLKDLSHLRLSFEDIASATNDFADENIITESKFVRSHTGRLMHSGQYIDIIAKDVYYEDEKV
ncbi:kinase-like domain, phloem protein 2-like protein [Tanacetum coccineum]